jgi:hypothetical protein
MNREKLHMFQQVFPQYDSAKHALKSGQACATSAIMNHKENPV